MISTQWPNTINTDFFAYSEKPKENATITEFLGGRTVGYKNNERAIKTISCSIEFSKGTESANFWSWFNDTLGGITGAFTCSALGSSYYRFVSIPEPQDTDQKRVTLSLNIEEVY